jgi:hypothetical protein
VLTVGDAVAVFVPVDVAPADHVYESAPFAVKVAVSPSQMLGEFTDTNGIALMVIVAVAVAAGQLDVAATVFVTV